MNTLVAFYAMGTSVWEPKAQRPSWRKNARAALGMNTLVAFYAMGTGVWEPKAQRPLWRKNARAVLGHKHARSFLRYRRWRLGA